MSIDVWKMISGKLDPLCHKYDFILIKDYQSLLDLPESYLAIGEAKPHRVIRCQGNLSFRLEYEPIRYASDRLILHVVGDSCFIPDLEARASLGEQILVFSLQSLLREAVGGGEIPTRINDHAAIVKGHFEAVTRCYRLFREEEGTIPTDAQLRRIILSALFGAKLFGKVESSALWNLYFERRQQIEELPGEELYGEFAAILAAAPWPLSNLRYNEPQVVRRSFWLIAILAQYLEDASAFMSQSYTNLLPREEFPLQEAENLARKLYSDYPELARRQIVETERELTSASIELLIEKLGLSFPERAVKVALEEEYSHLVLMLALYHVLLGLSDNLELVASAALGRLQRKLAGMTQEGLPYELRACIDLLNMLMDMLRIGERIEPQIRQLVQMGIRGFVSPEPFFRIYVKEKGYQLGIYSAEIRRILSLRMEDFPFVPHELDRSSWDLLRRSIEEQVAVADKVFGKFGEIFAKAAVRHYSVWLEGGDVTSAVGVVRGALSSAREAGHDRAYLLIFRGMGWSDFELRVRPLCAARYEIVVKPILAPSQGGGQKGLKDALCAEGIQFEERRKDLSLWLEAEGLEVVVFDHRWKWERPILEDELNSGAMVFITSGYLLGGDSSKLKEAILPLATLWPKARTERELVVSQLGLKDEYMEGAEDSFAFSVRCTGQNPFELVEVKMEMGELARVKPLQVLVTKQEKEILVPFTLSLANLSEEEKELAVIERTVKLSVIRREGERERCITRCGTLRVRLKKGAFTRTKDLTLDRTLGIRPKR